VAVVVAVAISCAGRGAAQHCFSQEESLRFVGADTQAARPRPAI